MPVRKGLGLILQGEQGIGKSALASQFPGPICGINCRESGFSDLIDAELIAEDQLEEEDVEDWADYLNLLDNIPDRFRTVITDSTSGLAYYMGQNILETVYHGDQDEFGQFSNGWRLQGPQWAAKVESRLNALRRRGINVILIGHVRDETAKDAMKNDYSRTCLDMEKWPRAVFTKWAQAVIYMKMEFDTKASKFWKKKATAFKVDAEEEVSRVMFTEVHPAHDAKNRLGLPPVIPMGNSAQEAYTNLISEFPTRIREHLQ